MWGMMAFPRASRRWARPAAFFGGGGVGNGVVPSSRAGSPSSTRQRRVATGSQCVPQFPPPKSSHVCHCEPMVGAWLFGSRSLMPVVWAGVPALRHRGLNPGEPGSPGGCCCWHRCRWGWGGAPLFSSVVRRRSFSIVPCGCCCR